MNEKRKNRGYKAKDKDYERAMERAIADKTPLATLIEGFIISYGKGFVNRMDRQRFFKETHY